MSSPNNMDTQPASSKLIGYKFIKIPELFLEASTKSWKSRPVDPRLPIGDRTGRTRFKPSIWFLFAQREETWL